MVWLAGTESGFVVGKPHFFVTDDIVKVKALCFPVELRFLLASKVLGETVCLHRVAHEHGHGHGTDAAGNRRYF